MSDISPIIGAHQVAHAQRECCARTVSAMAVTLAVFTGIQILVSGLLIPGGCRGRLRDPTAGPRDVDVPVGGGPWDVVL